MTPRCKEILLAVIVCLAITAFGSIMRGCVDIGKEQDTWTKTKNQPSLEK